MCGRYYVDEEMAGEIQRLVRTLDRKLRLGNAGDIVPSQCADVLRGKDGGSLTDEKMFWGFPRFEGKGLLINARAESALERKTFRESVRHRRCVIPAKGFYEWNRDKEKFSYERADAPVLFMAGCYDRYQDQDRFVILTTAANPSVAPVHDRMPLILEPGELEQWVFDEKGAEAILQKTPVMLRCSGEYEQLRLF